MLTSRPGYSEINYISNDFIWNEVMLWMVKQMQESPLKFTSIKFANSNVIDYESPGGIYFRSEISTERYSSNRTVQFFINRDLITKYKLTDCHFKDRNYFAIALKNGSYKDYSIEGEQINGVWTPCGFKNFTNLKVKRKVWEAVIDKGSYLNKDVTIQSIEWDDIKPRYLYVKKMGQCIIGMIKRNPAYKSFIKGEHIDEYKAKLVNKTIKQIKSTITLESITILLDLLKPKKIITHPDLSGPWSTSGTEEFVHVFDLSKIIGVNPLVESFVIANIEIIFNNLKKKRYSHSLGWYTLNGANFDQHKNLRLELSCKTYYN